MNETEFCVLHFQTLMGFHECGIFFNLLFILMFDLYHQHTTIEKTSHVRFNSPYACTRVCVFLWESEWDSRLACELYEWVYVCLWLYAFLIVILYKIHIKPNAATTATIMMGRMKRERQRYMHANSVNVSAEKVKISNERKHFFCIYVYI